MSDFAAELARLVAARGLGVRELARMVPVLTSDLTATAGRLVVTVRAGAATVIV